MQKLNRFPHKIKKEIKMNKIKYYRIQLKKLYKIWKEAVVLVYFHIKQDLEETIHINMNLKKKIQVNLRVNLQKIGHLIININHLEVLKVILHLKREKMKKIKVNHQYLKINHQILNLIMMHLKEKNIIQNMISLILLIKE